MTAPLLRGLPHELGLLGRLVLILRRSRRALLNGFRIALGIILVGIILVGRLGVARCRFTQRDTKGPWPWRQMHLRCLYPRRPSRRRPSASAALWRRPLIQSRPLPTDSQPRTISTIVQEGNLYTANSCRGRQSIWMLNLYTPKAVCSMITRTDRFPPITEHLGHCHLRGCRLD